MFDPFYRGADAPTGSTRLGLDIARAIAHAHEIRVGPGAQGRGTVIRVTFPGPDPRGSR